MDRSSIARLIIDGFWVFVLGIIVCALFFVAIGGIKPDDSTGLMIVLGVLIVAYAARAWAVSHRKSEQRDRRLIAARERRGF